MTPKMVGALMKKAREKLQKKSLRPQDLALLDAMIFRCRGPGMTKTSVSLTRLATLIGCCKQNVIGALRRLGLAGLLRKIKRRMKIPWMGGMASRQATNIYEFLPPATESAPQTVIREQSTPIPESVLEKALGRLRGLNEAVDFPQ